MGFVTRTINACIISNYTNVLRAFRVQQPRLLVSLNAEYRLPDSIHKAYSTHAGLYKANDRIKSYFDYLMNMNEKSGLESEPISEFVDPSAIKQLLSERIQLFENLRNLEQLVKDDSDMKKLAEEEKEVYNKQLTVIDEQLLEIILDSLSKQDYSNVIMEITVGIGGLEAMIFVNDLSKMYIGYIERMGMEYEILNLQKSGLGMRSITMLIVDKEAYKKFMYEGGVHRVQRIPATEKQGRMHTSTAKVVVLPELSDIDIEIHNKDLKIESKRASSAGGQHANTTDSSIRITHLPTGIVANCQESRSQLKNLKVAMIKLQNALYEQELEKQLSFKSSLSKKQKGLGLRNEKIRTYHFPQSRITDHRITDGTEHNLKEFMEGGPVFEKLTERVFMHMQTKILFEIIEKAENKQK